MKRGDYLEEALLSPKPIRQEALLQLNHERNGAESLFTWDVDQEILSDGLLIHENPQTLVDHPNPFLRAMMVEKGIGLDVLTWDNHPIVEQAWKKRKKAIQTVEDFMNSNS